MVFNRIVDAMDFTEACHQKFKVTAQWSDLWGNFLLYLVHQFTLKPKQSNNNLKYGTQCHFYHLSISCYVMSQQKNCLSINTAVFIKLITRSFLWNMFGTTWWKNKKDWERHSCTATTAGRNVMFCCCIKIFSAQETHQAPFQKYYCVTSEYIVVSSISVFFCTEDAPIKQ